SVSAPPARTTVPVAAGPGPVSNAAVGATTEGRILASPLAKTLAIELGVDLRQVQGSGPGGRIVERDVQAAAKTAPQESATGIEHPALEASPEDLPILSSTALALIPPGPLSVPGPSDEYVDKPLSNI